MCFPSTRTLIIVNFESFWWSIAEKERNEEHGFSTEYLDSGLQCSLGKSSSMIAVFHQTFIWKQAYSVSLDYMDLLFWKQDLKHEISPKNRYKSNWYFCNNQKQDLQIEYNTKKADKPLLLSKVQCQNIGNHKLCHRPFSWGQLKCLEMSFRSHKQSICTRPRFSQSQTIVLSA